MEINQVKNNGEKEGVGKQMGDGEDESREERKRSTVELGVSKVGGLSSCLVQVVGELEQRLEPLLG